jgi:hypothetical protein
VAVGVVASAPQVDQEVLGRPGHAPRLGARRGIDPDSARSS